MTPEADLSAYGEVVSREDGSTTLRVPKDRTARVTERLLADLPVVDLTVEDPPIEEVIERVFAAGGAAMRALPALYTQQFRTSLAVMLQYRASLLIWLISHVLEPWCISLCGRRLPRPREEASAGSGRRSSPRTSSFSCS